MKAAVLLVSMLMLVSCATGRSCQLDEILGGFAEAKSIQEEVEASRRFQLFVLECEPEDITYNIEAKDAEGNLLSLTNGEILKALRSDEHVTVVIYGEFTGFKFAAHRDGLLKYDSLLHLMMTE